MTDPEILDRVLQTCSYRFRSLQCPNKERVANISAAKFHMMEDADWTVIECSLLPSGEVKCGMTCLLDDFESEE